MDWAPAEHAGFFAERPNRRAAGSSRRAQHWGERDIGTPRSPPSGGPTWRELNRGPPNGRPSILFAPRALGIFTARVSGPIAWPSKRQTIKLLLGRARRRLLCPALAASLRNPPSNRPTDGELAKLITSAVSEQGRRFGRRHGSELSCIRAKVVAQLAAPDRGRIY